MIDTLTQAGIKTLFQESSGGHEWMNWRRYLNQTAPLMFQKHRRLRQLSVSSAQNPYRQAAHTSEVCWSLPASSPTTRTVSE